MAEVSIVGRLNNSDYSIEYDLPKDLVENASPIAMAVWLDEQKYKLISELSAQGMLNG